MLFNNDLKVVALSSAAVTKGDAPPAPRGCSRAGCLSCTHPELPVLCALLLSATKMRDDLCTC